MKILFRILVAFSILLIGLFVTAQVIVNRPFFREKITHVIAEKLNREVTLSGLGLSFFPNLGLNLKGFTIQEKDGKSSFLSLENLQIQAKILPLLKKKVVVSEIVLSTPKVNVVKDAQGNFNFSDLVSASSTPPKVADVPSPAVSSGGAPNLDIHSIQVSRAEFSYTDHSSEPSGAFKIAGLDVDIEHFSLDQPITIKLSCDLGSRSKFSVKGEVGPLNAGMEKGEANVEVALENLNSSDLSLFMGKGKEALHFEDLSIQGSLKGSLAKGIAGDLALSLKPSSSQTLDLKVKLEANTLDDVVIQEMNLKTGASDLSLHGQFQNFFSALNKSEKLPKFQLDLSSSQLNADDFAFAKGASTESQAPQPSAPSVQASTSVSQKGLENPLRTHSLFQNTQGSFSAQLKKVKVQGNEFNDIQVKARLQGGILSIETAELQAYDGKVKSAGEVNFQAQKIGYDLNFDVQGVELAKVSSANTGEEKIEGTLMGHGAFKAVGYARPDLERNLSGNALLEVKEGKILGNDIKSEVLMKMDNPILMQFLPGLSAMRDEAQQSPKKETPFHDFAVDLVVANGKAHLQKMTLHTEDFRFRANGVVDFALQANLEAHVVFSKELTEKMTRGQDLSNKLPYEDGGLHIPVKITGPLTKPRVMPDLATLISALTRGQLSDKVGGLLGGQKGGSNPLGQILGGQKSSSSGTSSNSGSSNTLGKIFGGGSQDQGGSEGGEENNSSSKLPFKLF